MPAATPAAKAAKRSAPAVPTPIWRKQNPLNSQGQAAQQVIKITKGLVLRQATLELTGAITATGANNTAANTAMGDEWALLQNLQIQANGSDVFRNFTGDDLWWLNWFWYQAPPNVTATVGDGATANPSFDSVLLLPFWYPGAYHPFDTLLNTQRFNDLQVLATFGGPTAMNSAATGFTVNPSIAVGTHEQLLPQDPNDQPQLNWVTKKLSNIPGGANSAFRVLLDAGVNYSRFLINVKNSTGTADAGSTAFASTLASLVSNIKVVGTGGRVYEDRSTTELFQECRIRKGLFQNAAAPARRSTSSSQSAWLEIDLCPDGRLKEAMANPQDAYLEFLVLGNCQINVFPSILFPIGAPASLAP